MTLQSRRRFWTGALTVILGWIAASRLGVIPLIEQAYRGESLPVFNDLISGQDALPVTRYVDMWLSISHRISAGLVFLAVLVYVALRLYGACRTQDTRAERRRHGRLSPSGVLGVALWIGLTAGLAEGAYMTVKGFWLGELVPGLFRVTQHAVWLTPLVSAVISVALGALLIAGYAGWNVVGSVRDGRRLPETGRFEGGGSPRSAWSPGPRIETVLVLLGAPATLGVLMAPGRMDLWAGVLLAVGIAVQGSRLAGARPTRFLHYVARSNRWLAATLVLLALAVPTWEKWRESRILGDLGQPSANAPNVLLIVLDTERAWNLSLYGHDRPTTPELDRLATRGVVFDRAVSTSPFTLTSHVSVFTGRWAEELGVDWETPLDRFTPTLAERMTEAGYVTGGFVANTAFCNDLFRLNRGFSWYEDNPVNLGQALLVNWTARNVSRWLRPRLGIHQQLGRKTAADLRADFLQWLDRSPDRPFFAFLNFFDAHAPYLPPEPWNVRFTDDGARYWLNEGNLSASLYTRQELRELEASYDNGIAYLDHQLGLLFGALEERGILDRTLVIVTSDHGEQFGEHGLVDHRNSLFMPLLHVPLVVLPPRDPERSGTGGGSAGPADSRDASRRSLRITAPVSTRNLAATVLDVAGIEDRRGLRGRSLRGYWTGGPVPSDTVLSEWGAGRSVIAGDYHLIAEGPDSLQLYDLSADPGELRDISGLAEYRNVLAGLARRIDESALAFRSRLAPRLTPPIAVRARQ